MEEPIRCTDRSIRQSRVMYFRVSDRANDRDAISIEESEIATVDNSVNTHFRISAMLDLRRTNRKGEIIIVARKHLPPLSEIPRAREETGLPQRRQEALVESSCSCSRAASRAATVRPGRARIINLH